MDMFCGCKPEDMPPHVYAIAQSAYDALKTTKQDQAIVVSGYSNSGKTTNVQHVVNYLRHMTAKLNPRKKIISGDFLVTFVLVCLEDRQITGLVFILFFIMFAFFS
jgi:myosin heavy subunit